jgi:hypothetical protein
MMMIATNFKKIEPAAKAPRVALAPFCGPEGRK